MTLRFSQYKTGQFDYDAESGRYLVSQYGAAYTDGNTGEQVGVTNLLVLETSIYVISGDTAGRLSVKLTRQRRGHLLLRRKGRAHHLEQGGTEQSSGLSPGRRHAAGAGEGDELRVHYVSPYQYLELYRMTH